MANSKYDPAVLKASPDLVLEDGVFYIVTTGLTREEKAHVFEQARLLNMKLARERGELVDDDA